MGDAELSFESRELHVNVRAHKTDETFCLELHLLAITLNKSLVPWKPSMGTPYNVELSTSAEF